jgi:hypothetical protein
MPSDVCGPDRQEPARVAAGDFVAIGKLTTGPENVAENSSEPVDLEPKALWHIQ